MAHVNRERQAAATLPRSLRGRSADGRLRLSRVYNSLGGIVTTLGPGWQHSFSGRLLISTAALPNLAPNSVSQMYGDPSAACSQGWNDIASSQPNSAGVTASWSGTSCVLSNGQTIPVFAAQPLSTYGSNLNTQIGITAYREDGARYSFTCQVECSAPGVAIGLSPGAGGSYTLTAEDGSIESYDSSGNVFSI